MFGGMNANTQAIEALRDAVGRLGLSEVARRLNVPRSTLSNVLAGAGRQGSTVLVMARAQEDAMLLRGASPMAMMPTPGVRFGDPR
jgi:hypothetical protein